MTDRPIIFCTPMVCALLDGRKTMTRRVVDRLTKFGAVKEFGRSTTAGYDWHFRDKRMAWNDLRDARLKEVLPWRVGDRLWVREALKARNMDVGGMLGLTEPLTKLDMSRGDVTGAYAVDDEPILDDREFDLAWLWKSKTLSARFMPRALSRLTLIVESIKVERLQEINRPDAIREGVAELRGGWWSAAAEGGQSAPSPVAAFMLLWKSLHGAIAWEANPWDAATGFRVEKRNIDEVPTADEDDRKTRLL